MATKIDKLEKALGEPFATEFPEYVRKIRNNLIIISVISISLILGGLEIAPDSSFLGVKFQGLNNTLIIRTIFSLNAYMFIHFLWCSYDFFQEWQLRTTGTRVAYVTAAKIADADCDYPNDPRKKGDRFIFPPCSSLDKSR